MPSITEARRALAQFDDQPPVLLIAVRDTSGQSVAVTTVRETTNRVPVPYPVEVALMDRDADPITAWLVAKTTPFYLRTGP